MDGCVFRPSNPKPNGVPFVAHRFSIQSWVSTKIRALLMFFWPLIASHQ